MAGGFTDTGNVCDGHWHDVAINGKLGAFGPCGECPSFDPDTPGDCSLRVHDNWFRAASEGVGRGCDQVHVGPNTVVPPSQPLPPPAAAVKSAAGPRY